MKSVVIIDDNPDMTMMLERFFKRFDKNNIKTFNNPFKALEYIQSEKVDFVLSDITMPNMDGLELLQNVKALKNPPKMIMMTAQSTLDRVLKSHRYEAHDFMIKPLDLNRLEKRIKELLEA
ncbi:response regulator [Sulfurimonas sp. HSL-1716]|uniref:response regulator n=1 Tax=Hydrocurvibacter sulfurireducens TaxID=3131937 RepID=UPI0031F7C083